MLSTLRKLVGIFFVFCALDGHTSLRSKIGRDDREQLKEAVFILGRELDDARYLRQFVEEVRLLKYKEG